MRWGCFRPTIDRAGVLAWTLVQVAGRRVALIAVLRPLFGVWADVGAASGDGEDQALLAEDIDGAQDGATNAVTHTASGHLGTFDVTIGRIPRSVRIEVRDAGSGGVPVARPQDGLAEDGRGLGLVELIADRWRHTGSEDGRSVFFELRWQPT
jgi:hypothetical protein